MKKKHLQLEIEYGTVHQLTTVLRESAKIIEQWEKDKPDNKHWWSKGQSGSFFTSLDVKDA